MANSGDRPSVGGGGGGSSGSVVAVVDVELATLLGSNPKMTNESFVALVRLFCELCDLRPTTAHFVAVAKDDEKKHKGRFHYGPIGVRWSRKVVRTRVGAPHLALLEFLARIGHADAAQADVERRKMNVWAYHPEEAHHSFFIVWPGHTEENMRLMAHLFHAGKPRISTRALLVSPAALTRPSDCSECRHDLNDADAYAAAVGVRFATPQDAIRHMHCTRCLRKPPHDGPIDVDPADVGHPWLAPNVARVVRIFPRQRLTTDGRLVSSSSSSSSSSIEGKRSALQADGGGADEEDEPTAVIITNDNPPRRIRSDWDTQQPLLMRRPRPASPDAPPPMPDDGELGALPAKLRKTCSRMRAFYRNGQDPAQAGLAAEMSTLDSHLRLAATQRERRFASAGYACGDFVGLPDFSTLDLLWAFAHPPRPRAPSAASWAPRCAGLQEDRNMAMRFHAAATIYINKPKQTPACKTVLAILNHDEFFSPLVELYAKYELQSLELPHPRTRQLARHLILGGQYETGKFLAQFAEALRYPLERIVDHRPCAVEKGSPLEVMFAAVASEDGESGGGAAATAGGSGTATLVRKMASVSIDAERALLMPPPPSPSSLSTSSSSSSSSSSLLRLPTRQSSVGGGGGGGVVKKKKKKKLAAAAPQSKKKAAARRLGEQEYEAGEGEEEVPAPRTRRRATVAVAAVADGAKPKSKAKAKARPKRKTAAAPATAEPPAKPRTRRKPATMEIATDPTIELLMRTQERKTARRTTAAAAAAAPRRRAETRPAPMSEEEDGEGEEEEEEDGEGDEEEEEEKVERRAAPEAGEEEEADDGQGDGGEEEELDGEEEEEEEDDDGEGEDEGDEGGYDDDDEEEEEVATEEEEEDEEEEEEEDEEEEEAPRKPRAARASPKKKRLPVPA